MKRKKAIILTISILALCVCTVGISFGYLTKTLTGEKEVSIVSGTLRIDFQDSNIITLDNIALMSDSKGLASEPYTFTITNTGNITAYYQVGFEDDSANTLNTQFVKMRMTGDNGYDSGVIRRSSFEDILLSAESMKVEEDVTYQLWMWLDENADNSAQGGIYQTKVVVNGQSSPYEEVGTPVAEVLLAGVGENGAINTDDPDQTFITGTDPNNYIWYSGKLWRAVSIDPSDNSVKLVTQWNISSIPYNARGNTAFEDSYMEEWLNDTSVDGFLGNLRDYENFIKTDSVWNATLTTATTKPVETTMVTAPVGLLNIYEYTMSYSGTTYQNGYLNNGIYWWTLTPYSTSLVRSVNDYGNASYDNPTYAYGVRPSINLKSSVKIVSGDGTESNPYRLAGDNDSNLNGTLLNTRYSGEYIIFGTRENMLYRIVSHETSGLTKIVSVERLGIASEFGYSNTDIYYSDTSPLGIFLNGDYLQNYVGSSYEGMIEPLTTWYLGTVGSGASYWLAKYSSTTGNELTSNTTLTGVGLLRYGELMLGQFSEDTGSYWTLTPSDASHVYSLTSDGGATPDTVVSSKSVRPAMNLKSNVIITGGTGTKEDPFTIALQS